MRCSSCKRVLDRYVEGTLSTQQLLRVAGHVRECGECSALLDELKVVDGLFATLTAPPPPAPNFTFAVMAEVRSMPPPQRPRSIALALTGAYVLVAWAIIAIWFAMTGTTVARAVAVTGSAFGGAAGIFHSVTGGLAGAFGSATPQVATFVVGVLALDTALALGIGALYLYVRPRLAARLASVRETPS